MAAIIPLKRKLENAILAYLDANKTGTTFAALTIVSGHGTKVGAVDEEGNTVIQEPDLPYLAVFVQTTPDADLPRVQQFEAVLHLKTDATDPVATRDTADEILRDVYDVLATPAPDGYDEALGDGNREFGAFLAYANKPATPPDERPANRQDLHLYGMWELAEPTLFDGAVWHDQISFGGCAQDMNSHEYPEAP